MLKLEQKVRRIKDNKTGKIIAVLEPDMFHAELEYNVEWDDGE